MKRIRNEREVFCIIIIKENEKDTFHTTWNFAKFLRPAEK